jgi:hypothetical protein
MQNTGNLIQKSVEQSTTRLVQRQKRFLVKKLYHFIEIDTRFVGAASVLSIDWPKA